MNDGRAMNAMTAVDALGWLRLQLDWGVDEALDDEPVARFLAPGARRTTLEARTDATRPVGTEAGHGFASDAAAAAPAPDGDGPFRDAGRPAAGTVAAAGATGPVGAARAAVASINDLAALEAAVGAFRASPLRRTAGAVVFTAGAPRASIGVVVDAPTAADDASGTPLSGDDGRFVAHMLGSIGIDDVDVRRCCLVPWRPPGDRAPTSTEIATGEVFARALLRIAPPRALLLLGPAATRTLGGVTGSARGVAGRIVEIAAGPDMSAVPALLLPPPATLARDARSKRLAWTALLALAERLFPPASNTIA